MPSPPKLTPMLEQYFEIKRQVPDAILFYRLGDFYEMFFEDAERAAPLLDLVLTARGKGGDTRRRCAACRITPPTATSPS